MQKSIKPLNPSSLKSRQTKSTKQPPLHKKRIKTTTKRRMGVKRMQPRGVETLDGLGDSFRAEAEERRKKRVEIELSPEYQLQESQKIEARLKQQKEREERVENQSPPRGNQPDEETVRRLAFLLMSSLENSPTLRSVLKDTATGVSLPSKSKSITNIATRYEHVRNIINASVEHLIEEVAEKGIIKFTNEPLLHVIFSQFFTVWDLYSVTGANNKPIARLLDQDFPPISRQLLTDGQITLSYAQMNDAFSKILLNACFGTPPEEIAKMKTTLTHKEAADVHARQLFITQQTDFAERVESITTQMGLIRPPKTAPANDRVKFFTAYRLAVRDIIAQSTMDNIMPKFGFEGELGYFLFQKALSAHQYSPQIESIIELIEKDINALTPSYVTQQEFDRVVNANNLASEQNARRRGLRPSPAIVENENDIEITLPEPETPSYEDLLKEDPFGIVSRAEYPRRKAVELSTPQQREATKKIKYVRAGGLKRPWRPTEEEVRAKLDELSELEDELEEAEHQEQNQSRFALPRQKVHSDSKIDIANQAQSRPVGGIPGNDGQPLSSFGNIMKNVPQGYVSYQDTADRQQSRPLQTRQQQQQQHAASKFSFQNVGGKL